MTEPLYAHYYVRFPEHPECSGETYVQVHLIDDDGRAHVLAGDQIAPAADACPDVFEFIALVREPDLHPNVQVHQHLTYMSIGNHQ